MKTKSILITTLVLMLTACVGLQETEPEEFAAPEVTAMPAGVSDKSLTVELSGSISGANTKIVKECGFFVSKNADMSDRTSIQSYARDSFSAQYTVKDFGTTFYYQAYISNGQYSVSSKALSFEVRPFEYYVTVSEPEIVSTDRTVIEVKSSVKWVDGVCLDEIGFLYGQNKDFSGATAVQQISKFDVITKSLDLQPGIDYYIKAYAKSGEHIHYSEAINLKVYILPKVTTSEVTEVTTSSATCGGVVESTGGASVTDYGIVYGTTQYLTVNNASKKSAGKGEKTFSTTISNLASGSTYYVRAYATNSQGTAYGEAVSFSTCKAATGISLNKTSLTLTQGLTETLEATVTPTDAYDKMVLWSTSNNTVATVTSSGTVKGIKPGTATITATTKDGGYKATCNVTVTSNITGISLNKTSLTLSKGATETLVATITPSNADQSVTWTTDNANVATVSSTGKVTAIAPGTTTITATTKDGSKQATCSVTVTGKVTGVSLNKTSLTLTQGSSETLAVTVTPNDAVNKAVTWSSSNTNVVTVTSSGTVKGISPGSATITVTTQDGGYKATCSVTVKSNIVSVTGISLNKTSISLYEGSSETLVATVTPSNATNKAVTWSSSNTSVATVTSSGVVTAKAAGSTTITVTTSDGGKTATCTVTVKAQIISVTGVSLDKTSLSMTAGDTQTLTATITPSNATNKTVTWSSSNTSVATVSSSGVVTAKAAGSTTITVTTSDGGKKATCTVTVKAQTISVTGVSLNKTSLSMIVGDTQTLTATITPSNATNKTVTWSSSNTSVATVSSSGVVTAKAAGSTTITVTTSDGGKKATCSVTVSSGSHSNVEPEAIDLGLSVKWASFNLGASKLEGYGYYYAWGEIGPKDIYDWSTYQWCKGEHNTLTKYCDDASYGYNGYIDNKYSLDLEDDAAHAILGSNWRMPTSSEWGELLNPNNCSWESTTVNGVAGYRITSKKIGYTDKWIFFPFAGYYDLPSHSYYGGGGYVGAGNVGAYWSSGISNSFGPHCAYCKAFLVRDGLESWAYYRCYGFSIRPVYGDL